VDVVDLHAPIGRTAPYTANRVVALFRAMFNKARYEWEWKGENAAERIKKLREVSRVRFLRPDELPPFFKALAAEPNQAIRDFVLLSLLAGARQGNVLAMRWDDVNLERRIWSIPQTKIGEPLEVVLAPEAVEILLRRMHTQPKDSRWVFPGKGKGEHLVGVRMAWARIRRAAGLRDLRLHDLRRTLGSWQAAAGSSLLIIGPSLGQRRTETTQIHARLNSNPVRQSVETATRALVQSAGRFLPGPVENAGGSA